MATKKEAGTARYRVLRDCAVGTEGDVVQLDPDLAADLVRDGMVAPAEEG